MRYVITYRVWPERNRPTKSPAGVGRPSGRNGSRCAAKPRSTHPLGMTAGRWKRGRQSLHQTQGRPLYDLCEDVLLELGDVTGRCCSACAATLYHGCASSA